MKRKPLRLSGLIVLGAAAFGAGVAEAQQTYPVRAVRLIVPSSPGGGTDITARILAPHMSQTLGQQLVAENRAGGAAIPGFDLVAKAPPGRRLLRRSSCRHRGGSPPRPAVRDIHRASAR